MIKSNLIEMDPEKEIFTKLYVQAKAERESGSLVEKIEHIDQRYEEIAVVDNGAKKEIHCINDVQTGREVAMATLINPDNPAEVEAFLREARIQARLQHPHIVPVYEIGLNESKEPFFTMKMVPGLNLEQIINKLREKDPETLRQYTLPKLLDIFLKICEAIAYAHSEKICHLDLKPANVRVSSFGEVMLCDWGLAKFTYDDDEKETDIENRDEFKHFDTNYMTLEGFIRGTPGYMAPEQARGKGESKNERTDVFALGVILYELLTHHRPFEGEDVEDILLNTVKGEFALPSKKYPDLKIPESLEAISMKCLEIEPLDRYQCVNDIINEIYKYREGFATQAEVPGILKQLRLFYLRNKAFCLTFILFTALIIIVVSFFINSLKEQEKIARNQAEIAKEQEKIALEKEQIATKALKDLKEKNTFIDDISDHSANSFGKTASYLFKTAKLSDALNAAEKGLQLDSQNSSALKTWIQIKLIQGRYDEAIPLLKENPKLSLLQLLQFAKAATKQEKQEGKLDHKTLYRLMTKHVESNKHALFRTYCLQNSLNFSNPKEFEERLSWFLQRENSTDEPINIKVSINDKSIALDLSGNRQLKDLSLLHYLPITELNISGTAVSKTQFMKNLPLEILDIRSTPIKTLKFIEAVSALKKIYLTKSLYTDKDLQVLNSINEVIDGKY